MPRPRRPLIAGNWKMNGLRSDAVALAGELVALMKGRPKPAFDMVVCPPFTVIADVGKTIAGSGIALGAQDCHAAEKGAHTGDISAAMLADLGCRFVIVGHSERRTNHGETDAIVKAKAEAIVSRRLTAIVCIGETEAERDAGNTLDVVKAQLAGSLPGKASAANVVVAYEPVWAIGTGRTPSDDEVQEVHALIRARLADALGAEESARLRVLYGGSMKPDNARALLALPDVDGGLIGGASLKSRDFWAIAESCL
ncbi:MAG TPA: triose-phosphate isomerase [Rhodospirillales bacterium]